MLHISHAVEPPLARGRVRGHREAILQVSRGRKGQGVRGDLKGSVQSEVAGGRLREKGKSVILSLSLSCLGLNKA